MSVRVHVADVTLSQLAAATARRHHIPASELQIARASCISTHETPEWLVVRATLRNGRRVRLCCSHALPTHIVKLDVD